MHTQSKRPQNACLASSPSYNRTKPSRWVFRVSCMCTPARTFHNPVLVFVESFSKWDVEGADDTTAASQRLWGGRNERRRGLRPLYFSAQVKKQTFLLLIPLSLLPLLSETGRLLWQQPKGYSGIYQRGGGGGVGGENTKHTPNKEIEQEKEKKGCIWRPLFSFTTPPLF